MMLYFSNDVVNDIESTQKVYKYVIIASLNSEPACKLIDLSFVSKFTRLGFENAC